MYICMHIKQWGVQIYTHKIVQFYSSNVYVHAINLANMVHTFLPLLELCNMLQLLQQNTFQMVLITP